MARFLFRSVISSCITMLLVSISLYWLLEVGSGDISVKILGVFSTPEQRASYRAQLGLDAPVWRRYLSWLIGNDWSTEDKIGLPLVSVKNPTSGESEWWVEIDDHLHRWNMKEGELIEMVRLKDGTVNSISAPPERWQQNGSKEQFFWGVDTKNNAVKWIRGSGEATWILTKAGLRKQGDGPKEYIPLRKGLLRGDAGMSLQYRRPVSGTMSVRIRNSLILAGAAFLIVMPLALFLGIIAGINEGKLLDRFISITSLGMTATPEFVSGIFLIMIFGIWFEILPAVVLFTSPNAIFENPSMLVLPVLTLTAVELGYVARMTRASMVEVMDSAYIRTAIIKGMPYWRVVILHAVRNALMAPITVIMLHVNWLVGGLVVVELIFGFPGLGKYIYDSAVFGDFNAVEAAAMVTVAIAIGTRLLGDLAYYLLNPRIRHQ